MQQMGQQGQLRAHSLSQGSMYEGHARLTENILLRMVHKERVSQCKGCMRVSRLSLLSVL